MLDDWISLDDQKGNMKQMSFAEILDLENGQQIPAFEGTVKRVFDQKTGVGEYGAWALQNLILQDEHANELTVTWACENPWTQADEGKHLFFESGRDKKDQLVGIKREIRTKNRKRYESVKVDDRAKVRTNNATTPDPDVPPDPKPNGDTGVFEARKHLCQAANLYNLCVKCVDSMIADELPEVARTSEQFQAAVGTLFIESSRAGFVQKMPTKAIKHE